MLTDANNDLYTVPEVAAMLGRSRGIIRDHMERRGLGRLIGRTWVLTAAEIDVIRLGLRDRPGRPRKEQTP